MTINTFELATKYDPKLTESKWQKAWETHQVFKAEATKKEKIFCMVIPPPNVTGSLHMGHAFEDCLMDVLVRYHRMSGKNTLCLPGTDPCMQNIQHCVDYSPAGSLYFSL